MQIQQSWLSLLPHSLLAGGGGEAGGVWNNWGGGLGRGGEGVSYSQHTLSSLILIKYFLLISDSPTIEDFSMSSLSTLILYNLPCFWAKDRFYLNIQTYLNLYSNDSLVSSFLVSAKPRGWEKGILFDWALPYPLSCAWGYGMRDNQCFDVTSTHASTTYDSDPNVKTSEFNDPKTFRPLDIKSQK